MRETARFDDDEELAGEWRPVGPGAVLTLAVVAAFILVFQRFSEGQWVPILDSANLALHEAGHPFFGLLSTRLGVYGGTLFQLLFPLAVLFHFHRRGETLGFAVGLAWLGENLLNIGRYMADARAQLLPLVGGGEHDWTEIFARWGVLAADVRIGGMTRFLGYLMILAAVAWLWRRWRSGNEEKS